MLTILYWTASFVLNLPNALKTQIVFSFLEQFLIQIPRYTLFTYSIDNDFKLLPGRVNFVIVLYHSLYVTLTALTTDIVSIIQQASFGGVESQDLLISIRCKEMMF